MNVIAAIFARGGSRGVARKNLRELGGVPLVVRAIEQAMSVRTVERVILSTDDAAIADVGAAAGAEVPWLRPSSLATDTAREWDAWRHLLGWLDERGEAPDRLLVVPCTAPLRTVDDLERCVAAATAGVDIVVSVAEARRNPWFNMVTIDAEGDAHLVLEPTRRIHRRQDAPSVFDVGTVAFVADPEYVRRAESLYDGRVRAVQVPTDRCLDIDTELDLVLAELLLARRHGSS
jgi:N-acylneuraminate cytidylyltransferase